MKKTFLISCILLFSLVGCSNNNNEETNLITTKENSSYNYTATRTIKPEENTSSENEIKPETNQETDLSSFSTKIYTPNDTARQNNISLTCSKLNGTIVKSRRNFFFLQYSRKSYS